MQENSQSALRRARAALALPKIEMIQRHHDQRVPNLIRLYQMGQLSNRNQSGDDILATIKFNRVHEAAIPHHDREAGVAHDGRVGEHFADGFRVAAFITGFLTQLPQARGHG